jgi:flagellar biosynthesis regulator FlaF
MPQALSRGAAYRRAITPKQLEAEIFARVSRGLREAEAPLDRMRAVADTERLWSAVRDVTLDPSNSLPAELRAGLASLAGAAIRECGTEEPDIAFLLEITDQVAGGLWS